jgi:endonuclease YncB( thermonuclease family)
MCVLVPTASLALGFGGAAVFRHLLNRYHPLVLLDDGANNGAPASWRPHVVKVIDGDTIEVDTGKGKEKVRLLGIDTPVISGQAVAR